MVQDTKKFANTSHLRDLLLRGGLSQHSNVEHFDLNDEDVRAHLVEVQTQYPKHSLDEQHARAIYRTLTHIDRGPLAPKQKSPSEPILENPKVVRNRKVLWILKIAAIVIALLLLGVIAAKADPTPEYNTSYSSFLMTLSHRVFFAPDPQGGVQPVNLVYNSASNPLYVSCVGGTCSGGGGGGGTSSTFGAAFPSLGTAVGASDGVNMLPLLLDGAGNLKVNVAAGGASGGTSSSFGAAFPATGTAIGVSDGTNMVALKLGQALAAASIPVILPSATITTLTPPTAAAIGTSVSTDLLIGTQTAGASVPTALPTATITTLTPPTAAAIAAAVVANPPTVPASQSGTWNINNVSGTVSLPTGASTSSLQTTGNTSLASIDTKTPALGQALAAASVPVVMPTASITTLTPPTAAAIGTAVAADLLIGTQTAGASAPVALPTATITTLTPPSAAAIAAAIVSNPPTVPVTGTFFQSTQPVSCTGANCSVKSTDGTNTAIIDPCQGQTKTSTPINQAAVGPTTLVAGTSAKKTYICSMLLVSATAQNVNLVEGTGSNCSSVSSGVLGGTTAATGPNIAANTGWNSGNGEGYIAATATNADNLCIIVSSTGQISGNLTWTQQ